MQFFYCATVIMASIVLGGGTHSGFLSDIVVQLLASGLLAFDVWILLGGRENLRKSGRLFAVVSAVAVILILLQTAPLPFDYWPGGAAAFLEKSEYSGQVQFPAVHTISVTPEETWAAGVSLVVPLSIFGSVICLDLRARLHICALILAAGACSLVLGFLQLAEGPDSFLRFYEFTNISDPVGFFANRNHFAAFLNVNLVLSAFWLAVLGKRVLHQEAAAETRTFFWLALSASAFVAMFTGVAMTRSRAGIILAMMALAGVAALIGAHFRKGRQGAGLFKKMGPREVLAALIFALFFAAETSLGNIVPRFDEDPLHDLRASLNRAMTGLIPKALPFGTGLGSFVSVYGAAERREDMFPNYANRAHNDVAEFLLEAGVPGAAIVLTFLAWLSLRSYKVWTIRPPDDQATGILLQRAATLVLALYAAHSAVDYPLRTAASSAVFACFCAMLATAPPSGRGTKHLSRGSNKNKLRHRAQLARWEPSAGWPRDWNS